MKFTLKNIDPRLIVTNQYPPIESVAYLLENDLLLTSVCHFIDGYLGDDAPGYKIIEKEFKTYGKKLSPFKAHTLTRRVFSSYLSDIINIKDWQGKQIFREIFSEESLSQFTDKLQEQVVVMYLEIASDNETHKPTK